MRKIIIILFTIFLFLPPALLLVNSVHNYSTQSSHRAIIRPKVTTQKAAEITGSSAVLYGTIENDGGEGCSVWFEWDEVQVDVEVDAEARAKSAAETESEACAGLIATGSVCKNGRSIIMKNRHSPEPDQKPRFFKGDNHTYFGVGSTDEMCRMGQNQKGLAMANFDVNKAMINWKYTSDGSSGSEDNDFHNILGNFSKVAEAAFWLAKHGYHPGQNVIISSEPGVGAVVGVDSNLHSSIVWINNSYAGIANAFYCDGDSDSDGNDRRAQQLLNDIVNNGTSSEGDNKINWQDAAQRIAKDTNGKEFGEGIFSYANEISRGSSNSAFVAAAGNESFAGTNFMAWVNIAPTTQVGIFLPIYAGGLRTSTDIPINFSEDNDGKGIYPYGQVKHNYASDGELDHYNCSRVREIKRYAEFNENITFDEFDSLIKNLSSAASAAIVQALLSDFVNITLPIALKGYIENQTKKLNKTEKQYSQPVVDFYQTLIGLRPGTVYKYKACANNSMYTVTGSEMRFLTRPEQPTNVQINTINKSQIELKWSPSISASRTVIERHTISTWSFGEGIQIYNGTGDKFTDPNLKPDTEYYYQFWSYISKLGFSQYSSTFGFGDNKTLLDNRPPIINTKPVTQATENELYFVLYEYTDLDGDPVTWGVDTNASWLDLNNNNLSGTPGDFDLGPYYVNVSCSDNNGSIVYSNFSLTIISTPDPPVLTLKVKNIEFEEDSFFILDLSEKGLDVDGDELFWYFEDVDDEMLNITKINNYTFNISGKKDEHGQNRVTLCLEEVSLKKLKTFQQLWLNVTAVNDRPGKPEFTYIVKYPLKSSSVENGVIVEFIATIPKDVDGEVRFNYSWDFDNDGEIDVMGKNLVKVNFTYLADGNYNVNLTVTDSGGLYNWINKIIQIAEVNITDGKDNDKVDSASELHVFSIIFISILIIMIIIIILILIIFKKRKRNVI